MALSFEDKKAIVAEVSEVASSAISLVVADYRGLTVPQMTELRKQARESAVFLKIVRNNLAKRAIQGTDFQCMEGALTGPLIFGFAKNEPGAAAKLFKRFAKENEALEVKALAVGDQYYEASHLDAVASLPSRDEAFGQLAAMLMAPLNQLARTVAEPGSQLVRCIDGTKAQKTQ